MNKTLVGPILFEGYASGQYDFEPVFNQANEETKLQFWALIDAFVLAINNPTIVYCHDVIGHSDRVDTPGLESSARRNLEYEAAENRCARFSEFYQSILLHRIPGLTYERLIEINRNENIDVIAHPKGAAKLKIDKPILTEDERKQNRRIEIYYILFNS